MRLFAGCFQLLMTLLGVLVLGGAILEPNWVMLLIGLGVTVTSVITLCHIITRRPNPLSRYPSDWEQRRRKERDRA